MNQQSITRLVDEIAQLERAAEAAVYLVDHLDHLVPPDSAYWRQQVGMTVALLESLVGMLLSRLEALGWE